MTIWFVPTEQRRTRASQPVSAPSQERDRATVGRDYGRRWDRWAQPWVTVASLTMYFAADSRLWRAEAAMERVRIRRRSKRRLDEAVDDMPTRPVVSTDDAAELITQIDLLLDE